MMLRTNQNNNNYVFIAGFSLSLMAALNIINNLIETGFDTDQNGRVEDIEIQSSLALVGLSFSLTGYCAYKLKQSSLVQNSYQHLRNRFVMWRDRELIAKLDAMREEFYELQNQFDDLDETQLNTLVEQGLAEKNGGEISLQYICPISHELMFDPVEIRVKEEDGIAVEIYDRKSITDFFMTDPWAANSPATRREFVDKKIRPYRGWDEYDTYIENLQEEMAKFLDEPAVRKVK